MAKKLKSKRPSWDKYFLELADAASKRATCDRGRSGCVIVRDRQVLATGYVGSPIGLPHCDEVGHLMKKYCRRMVKSPRIVYVLCILNRMLFVRLQKEGYRLMERQSILE
jgi:deoxycytidylate deaminase